MELSGFLSGKVLACLGGERKVCWYTVENDGVYGRILNL